MLPSDSWIIFNILFVVSVTILLFSASFFLNLKPITRYEIENNNIDKIAKEGSKNIKVVIRKINIIIAATNWREKFIATIVCKT